MSGARYDWQARAIAAEQEMVRLKTALACCPLAFTRCAAMRDALAPPAQGSDNDEGLAR